MNELIYNVYDVVRLNTQLEHNVMYIFGLTWALSLFTIFNVFNAKVGAQKKEFKIKPTVILFVGLVGGIATLNIAEYVYTYPTPDKVFNKVCIDNYDMMAVMEAMHNSSDELQDLMSGKTIHDTFNQACSNFQ